MTKLLKGEEFNKFCCCCYFLGFFGGAEGERVRGVVTSTYIRFAVEGVAILFRIGIHFSPTLVFQLQMLNQLTYLNPFILLLNTYP